MRGSHNEAAGNKSRNFKKIIIKAGNLKKKKKSITILCREILCVCVQYNMMTLSKVRVSIQMYVCFGVVLRLVLTI